MRGVLVRSALLMMFGPDSARGAFLEVGFASFELPPTVRSAPSTVEWGASKTMLDCWSEMAVVPLPSVHIRPRDVRGAIVLSVITRSIFGIWGRKPVQVTGPGTGSRSPSETLSPPYFERS